MDVLGLKSYRWLLIVCYLCWGHGVICVLVQPSLAVTQKVIILPFPVPRVVSNVVQIVCIGYVPNLRKYFSNV